MSEAVTNLGVRPVFPPTESLRLGTILLVDASIGLPGSGAPAHQETSLRITSDLEAAFEAARRKQFSAQEANRFFPSSSDLTDALRPTTTGHAFFRQTTKLGSGEARPPNALPLAALPGYTLASVDQGSFAAFLPGLIASFFTAIGFRHTSYLRIEAEGVEVAELPLADLVTTLDAACRAPAIRARQTAYSRGVSMAYDIFESQRRRREKTGGPKGAVVPRLHLLRKVFYMRGVRFVTEDSRVTAAVLDATVKKTLPDGASTVPTPSITVNNNPAPKDAAGTAGPQGNNNNAAIAALQAQIGELRTALAKGSNAQFGASFARAATTGVELVQLFDRPLAFGYQSLVVTVDITTGTNGMAVASPGWRPLCDEATLPQ